jgi:hypothetical protein
VNMIGHPTVCVNTHTKSFYDFLDERTKSIAISAREENCFAMVTAQDHMIAATFDVNTKSSWHPCHSMLLMGRPFSTRRSLLRARISW